MHCRKRILLVVILTVLEQLKQLLESIVKIKTFCPITLNFISTRMQLAEWSAEISECYRIERKSLSHTLVTRIKLNSN